MQFLFLAGGWPIVTKEISAFIFKATTKNY